GRLIRLLRGHTKYVLQLAFSSDGGVLASTSEDQTIRLWNTADWSPLSDPLRGHNHEVNAVAFSSNGGVLASGNKDGEVLLWKIDARRPENGRRELPSDVQRVIPLPVRRMVLGKRSNARWSLIDLLT